MLTRILVALTAVLLLPLSACGGGGDDGRPVVVTSFYPLEFLVQRIAGDTVDVLNLTEPGVEPHDLDPSIKQVAEISDAALVVYSKGLQPAVDDTVSQNAKDSVDVSKVVDLGDENPHFWLDPLRMLKAADAVEKQLAELVPDDAETFATNLAVLREELTELDRSFSDGLADCARDLVVTTHDAFGFWARYGLEFAPIAGLSPDAEPSPAHLAELRDLIKDKGVTTVFSETIASPKLANALADDLGLKTDVLDPIEGQRKDNPQDYLEMMKGDLVSLQQALGCTGRLNP